MRNSSTQNSAEDSRPSYSTSALILLLVAQWDTENDRFLEFFHGEELRLLVVGLSHPAVNTTSASDQKCNALPTRDRDREDHFLSIASPVQGK